MKNLLLTILGMILLIPSISSAANDEIVWEKDYPLFVGNDFLLLEEQNTFLVYSRNKIYELSISTGELQDSISFESYFKNINKISITDDDRYLAISGDKPYLLIWDLANNIEYKRFTTEIVDRDESHSVGSWASASISGDGTKISGIAKSSFDYFTKLIVFNVQSGDTLLSQVRNLRGQTPFDPSFEWISTEFSPNGDYLVAQLDMTRENGGVADDSLYIYRTNPFAIDNVINNSSTDPGYPTRQFSFSSYENLLATSIELENKLILYNFETRNIKIYQFDNFPYSLLFANNSSQFILNLHDKTIIYDYKEAKETYRYFNRVWANAITQNDTKILGYGGKNIICVNGVWTPTSVNNNTSQTILYPNPVNSILKINFNVSRGANFRYDLFDINSNKVTTNSLNFLQEGINEININFNLYTPQTYFLKIYSSYESFNFKIIKD